MKVNVLEWNAPFEDQKLYVKLNKGKKKKRRPDENEKEE